MIDADLAKKGNPDKLYRIHYRTLATDVDHWTKWEHWLSYKTPEARDRALVHLRDVPDNLNFVIEFRAWDILPKD